MNHGLLKVRDHLRPQLERLRHRLIDAMKSTAADLNQYAERLEREGTAAGVNRFGVLQSRTSTIEVLVGRYGELQDALDEIEAQIKLETPQARMAAPKAPVEADHEETHEEYVARKQSEKLADSSI